MSQTTRTVRRRSRTGPADGDGDTPHVTLHPDANSGLDECQQSDGDLQRDTSQALAGDRTSRAPARTTRRDDDCQPGTSRDGDCQRGTAQAIPHTWSRKGATSRDEDCQRTHTTRQDRGCQHGTSGSMPAHNDHRQGAPHAKRARCHMPRDRSSSSSSSSSSPSPSPHRRRLG